MIKYHLFKSKKYPGRAITIGEHEDGAYFIPSDPTNTRFDTIEQIEISLEDELSLILPKNQVN